MRGLEPRSIELAVRSNLRRALWRISEAFPGFCRSDSVLQCSSDTLEILLLHFEEQNGLDTYLRQSFLTP